MTETTPLCCHFDERRAAFIVDHPFRYVDACPGLPVRTLDIPSGFPFRGSVPRWVRWAIETVEVSDTGSCVHDWVYAHAGWMPNGVRYTRQEADALFLRIMLAEGVPPARAILAYYAVRLGGWWPWWRAGRRHSGAAHRSSA